MKLNNLKVQELNAQELQKLDGGQIREGLELAKEVFDLLWENRNTRFVRNLFKGTDPYYP